MEFSNIPDESPESSAMVKALANLDHLRIMGCEFSTKQLTDLFMEMSKTNMTQIELDGLNPDERFLYFPPVPDFVLAKGLSSVTRIKLANDDLKPSQWESLFREILKQDPTKAGVFVVLVILPSLSFVAVSRLFSF